ncbi:MAG: cupin domain-containing protein [Myxococcales bacterium]|jgi:cupin 2 domain-containing protein
MASEDEARAVVFEATDATLLDIIQNMLESEGLDPRRLGRTHAALMGGGNAGFAQLIDVPARHRELALQLIEASTSGPVDDLEEQALAAGAGATGRRVRSDPGAVQRGRLPGAIPDSLPEELLTTLVSVAGVRIERIVSRGHRSPPGFWYDQDEHEFVLLIEGAARLEVETTGEVPLEAGEWVHIPAHTRHRVSWTDPDADTVWLAVFHPAAPPG